MIFKQLMIIANLLNVLDTIPNITIENTKSFDHVYCIIANMRKLEIMLVSKKLLIYQFT